MSIEALLDYRLALLQSSSHFAPLGMSQHLTPSSLLDPAGGRAGGLCDFVAAVSNRPRITGDAGDAGAARAAGDAGHAADAINGRDPAPAALEGGSWFDYNARDSPPVHAY